MLRQRIDTPQKMPRKVASGAFTPILVNSKNKDCGRRKAIRRRAIGRIKERASWHCSQERSCMRDFLPHREDLCVA